MIDLILYEFQELGLFADCFASFSLCFILFFLRRLLLSISRRLSTFLCLAIDLLLSCVFYLRYLIAESVA